MATTSDLTLSGREKKIESAFVPAGSRETETVKLGMAKSATQEMASEIARISQTRVVEVERVSFACGPVTLKMVKTTLGPGWLLNDKVLFSSVDLGDLHKAAKAFYLNIKTNAKPESNHFNVRFGGTDHIVWSVHHFNALTEMDEPLTELFCLLKTPPILID